MRSQCIVKESSKIRSYKDIVRNFIREHRKDAIKELRYYQIQRSLKDAIALAALAKLPNGTRHSHQRRIQASVLNKAKEKLLTVKLGKCKTFDDLHTAVEVCIKPIKGIGELTIYDTALRIGAYLGLMPEHIYIHAGVCNGAKALGFRNNTSKIMKVELPAPFQKLEPYEIEDCLCIYKDELNQIKMKSSSTNISDKIDLKYEGKG